MSPFEETQSKVMRAYVQYYTIVESRVRLTWYQSHDSHDSTSYEYKIEFFF